MILFDDSILAKMTSTNKYTIQQYFVDTIIGVW